MCVYPYEIYHNSNITYQRVFDREEQANILSVKILWPQTGPGFEVNHFHDLLGGGILGDSLGTLRHGVFGKFAREEQPHCGLDFPRSDGGPLIVVSEARCLTCNTLKDVVHERVHDGHGL